ncbi:hypothetical protein SNE40_004099 [Patella caerulea]|uniref:Uncharacterized protein n=1 Tax=Patella caerulea TaxID=87958 RepID=A0AAN8Q685_PATCE
MDIRRLGVFEKQEEAIQELKQMMHMLREAETQRKQMIHILQDKYTGPQESIRKLEKSNVETKKAMSGLQHSVDIHQEEIQSLKMMVKPNNSIESSLLTNVTNQSKDVKLSSGNVNKEVLSDETTARNKTKDQLS